MKPFFERMIPDKELKRLAETSRRPRCVILESPYAGEIEANVAYARRAMFDCLERGEAPFASHLLYTQVGVLDDSDPTQRQRGIEAGLAWGTEAAATVVYTDRGISRGMEYGIERAKRDGRPVEMRSLGLTSIVQCFAPEKLLAGEILDELNRARTKFPGKNVTFAALVEEVGELATATFEEGRERVRKEAVQVAVMAMRMILDGDHTFDNWRASKGLDPLVERTEGLHSHAVAAAIAETGGRGL